MNDSPQKLTVDNVPPSKHRTLRWKGGAGILLAATVAAIGARFFTPDQTFQVISFFYIAGTTIGAMLIWWIFFSGLKIRHRLTGLLLAVGSAAIFFQISVRDIYFDGDMRPRIRWRWQESPADRTAAWLHRTSAETSQRSTIAPTAVLQVTETDWPGYCGFRADRIIRDTVPPELDWKNNPPAELWRHPVGEAWSSFAIVGDYAFTQEQRGDLECVVCYEAATGREVWCHTDKTRYETPMGAIGPRATPMVTDDALFALGATGILNSLNPVTGNVIWQKNIVSDAGSSVLEWGMSGSPLIYDNMVIVDAGGQQGRAVIAYDFRTGEIRWSAENHQAGYAAPRIEPIDGKMQLLIFHGEGLLSIDPHDGKRLWEYPWTNLYKINVTQPILSRNQIFISSGYDAGCVLLDPLKLSAGRPQEIWPPSKSMKLKFNEAVYRDGYVYGLDDGILSCVDFQTGERKWKGGRYRYGQVLLWDQLLLIQAEKGSVALVDARPDEFKEVTRFEALSDRTWNVPVVCRGKLFVRNANEAACFRLLTDDRTNQKEQ